MKNCLVVEDSRVMRTVARRIFEELQFDIGEAEDGMAGLRACRDKMPDVIFLDWNLPSMPGLEFIKSVRGQQNGAHPVILFATTENDPDEIAQRHRRRRRRLYDEALRPRCRCAPSWSNSGSPLEPIRKCA